MAEISQSDFIAVNVTGSRFKNASFKSCLFFECRFRDADFEGAVFRDCYFVSCNFHGVQHLNFQNKQNSNVEVLKAVPLLSDEAKDVQELILQLVKNKAERYRILTTKEGKVNVWLVSILLRKFGLERVRVALSRLLDHEERFFCFDQYIQYVHKVTGIAS